MTHPVKRRDFVAMLSAAIAWSGLPFRSLLAQNEKAGDRNVEGEQPHREQPSPPSENQNVLPDDLKSYALLSLVLGRISDRSVTVSAVSQEAREGYFEYGLTSGNYSDKSKIIDLPRGQPVEVVLRDLKPDTQYFYRLNSRLKGGADYSHGEECRFHTQRSPGSHFRFAVQGDSHPERPQMHDPGLYARTLRNISMGNPDFLVCMGDDFSVAKLRTIDDETLKQPYTLQRPFLGLAARSAPLFLLNGNHEQASLFNFNQTDIRHEVAVGAQKARNLYYPTPTPDGFYSGNEHPLQSIGSLRDYYAWTWGDALFVILDNYWHSPTLVDSGFGERGGNGGRGGGHGKGLGQGQGHQQEAEDTKVAKSEQGRKQSGGHGNRDLWDVTMGDEQYQWFRKTLEQSTAKFKFVFAHHVLGTNRGGVDVSDLYEWGGHDRQGNWEFPEHRPGWELPVHQLMVKHGVTIFFQGHDHLFAKQERDGIIYQEVPMPADQFYRAWNIEHYGSGVMLPNSGHLEVSVSPHEVKVDYIASFLPKDETSLKRTGDLLHSYSVKPNATHA